MPNVYKSCPKMISLEKWKILTPFQKLPKNAGDLGKQLILTTGFEKMPKVKSIAQSGHTDWKHEWVFLYFWDDTQRVEQIGCSVKQNLLVDYRNDLAFANLLKSWLLTLVVYLQSVWSDWAIFVRSWRLIFGKNLAKIFGNFWGYFKNVKSLINWF